MRFDMRSSISTFRLSSTFPWPFQNPLNVFPNLKCGFASSYNKTLLRRSPSLFLSSAGHVPTTRYFNNCQSSLTRVLIFNNNPKKSFFSSKTHQFPFNHDLPHILKEKSQCPYQEPTNLEIAGSISVKLLPENKVNPTDIKNDCKNDTYNDDLVRKSSDNKHDPLNHFIKYGQAQMSISNIPSSRPSKFQASLYPTLGTLPLRRLFGFLSEILSNDSFNLVDHCFMGNSGDDFYLDFYYDSLLKPNSRIMKDSNIVTSLALPSSMEVFERVIAMDNSQASSLEILTLRPFFRIKNRLLRGVVEINIFQALNTISKPQKRIKGDKGDSAANCGEGNKFTIICDGGARAIYDKKLGVEIKGSHCASAVVVKDSSDKIILTAKTGFEIPTCDPNVPEVIAIILAFRIAERMKLTNFVVINDCDPIINQITQGKPSSRLQELYPGISSFMRNFPSTFNTNCLTFMRGVHVQDAHDLCDQILDEVSRSVQNAAKQFRERFKNSVPLPKQVNGKKKREIRNVTKIKE